MPGAPSIGSAALEARRVLEAAGVEHAAVSAEWLLEWITGYSRAELQLHADDPLELGKRLQLMAATARRAAGEPLQYITGRAPFRALEVACEPGVLIPRPETELLVELALAALDARGGGGREGREPRESRVLDLCCGSGCIACAIARERDGARVWATDLSPQAVALAERNARELGVAERVTVFEGDLAEPVAPELRGTFDLVVSNPPYVPSAVVDELPLEVRAHEPRLALDGGEDGLSLVRRILSAAPELLAPGGTLALELFEGHVGEAVELARAVSGRAGEPAFSSVRAELDLAGRPRYLVARAAGAGGEV